MDVLMAFCRASIAACCAGGPLRSHAQAPGQQHGERHAAQQNCMPLHVMQELFMVVCLCLRPGM